MIEEQEDTQEIEQAVLRHTRQVYSHLLSGLLVLFVAVGLSVGGLVVLSNLLRTADELLAVEPENRSEALKKQIASVRNDVEKQYQEYHSRMEDDSVFRINKAFAVMYQVSGQFEADYAKLLLGYQKTSFNLASRIRGSGEWYFYYERELSAYIERQKVLDSQLKAYLADHESFTDR